MAATDESSWQASAARKRAAVLAKIPEEWRLSPEDIARASPSAQRDLTGPFMKQFLSPAEWDVVSMDSVPIVEAIGAGRLTAVKVTEAFCKAAAVAHQIGNCLHEIFFDQAIARARELDEYQTSHGGATTGPLHGLPVSLKDQFHVKGVETSMGYVGWIGGKMNISHDLAECMHVESQATKELLSLGAVLYCKTSLPQTLMLGETENNIFGRTLNPHNQKLSCGGSSGGEGALQALRGSTVGLGTDIGGSVRIPAGFCGIYALKPTPERLSYKDAANTNPGQNTYRSTVGYLSTSLDGLDLMLRSVLSTKPWRRDPAVVPIPYREDVAPAYKSRPLKLGILWRDEILEPHPPVRRGVKMVADAVRAAGHKVVDWNPPPHKDAIQVHAGFLFADGAHDVHSHLDLSGEPLIPQLQANFQLRDPIPLLEYQDLTIRGLEQEIKFSDYWESTAAEDGQEVDAYISPVLPYAAAPPGLPNYPSEFFDLAYSYTEIVNALNYSAVVIPVTKADRSLDPVDADYVPRDEIDRITWECYDPDLVDGTPVGVQIVTRKFEEEKALAIARVVCAALQQQKERPESHL